MANTRALKARIASAEGILQVTKSMKMVSASKMRRVQAAKNSLGPMAEKSRRLLAQVTAGAGETREPLLSVRQEVKRVCYVLIVGNRGLCGVYNTALVKYLEELLARDERDSTLVVCGSWGKDEIEPILPVDRRFDGIGDLPTAREAGELADYLKGLYRSGETDEVIFVYQRYDSFLKQTPSRFTLLPVRPAQGGKSADGILFEPDKDSLISRLKELYVSSAVYDLLLEGRTGEHAARMSSMTSAADNTEELIRKLTLDLNHIRQAAITTEISEIAGGAEALNGVKS